MELTGREFSVRHEIISEEWVFTKFGSLVKDNHQDTGAPFSLTKVEFSELDGKINHGVAVYNGSMVTLRPSRKQPSASVSDFYKNEKSFKLIFSRNKSSKKDDVAAIEGTFVHEPFNTQLIGRFTVTDTNGNLKQSQNFVLHKSQQVRLSFLFKEGDSVSFNAEVGSGTISNRTNQITMTSNSPESHFVSFVQHITTNEQGTFILHGDLSNLSAPSKQRTQERMQQDMRLTQVTSVRKRGSKGSMLQNKDMKVTAESSVREILQTQCVRMPLSGVIQTLTIGGSPLTLSMTILLSEPAQTGRQSDYTIKFIEEQLNEEEFNADAAIEEGFEEEAVQIAGITPQSWASDYPLFAYNSFLPDSSEIIIVNMAEHEKRQQVLDIGPQWRFISFVESTVITQQLNLMASRLDCQIYFLAQHKYLRKFFLLGLNKDPWSPEKFPELFIIKTCDIKLPPQSLAQLKSIHLLSRSVKEELEMTLMFQFEG